MLSYGLLNSVKISYMKVFLVKTDFKILWLIYFIEFGAYKFSKTTLYVGWFGAREIMSK